MALLPSYDNSQKIAGLFSNPALLGCFLAIGVCLSLNKVLNKGNCAQNFINLLLFVLILAGLVLSGSRTAWIAAFIPCAFIIMQHYSSVRLKAIKAQLSLILILLLISFVIAGFCLYNMNTDSISGRMLIWKIGLSMFNDHPLFGMSYGSFYTEYGNYQADYRIW